MKKIIILISLFLTIGCVQATGKRAVEVTIPNKTKSQSDFGSYHALLIYVEDYTHIKKLKTPKNDVEAISKILENRYGFEVEIIDNPRNYDELVTKLDNKRKSLTSNDNLLIYYAGHGTYINSNKGYWLLKDANKANRAGWISVKEAVNTTLSLTDAKHILVISDSCYAGAILRSVGTNLRGGSINYNNLQQKKSRTALTSGGLEPVSDTDPSHPNNSVFTNGFLNSLKNNKKPLFTLQEKFAEISGYVIENAEQEPEYSNIRGIGHEKGADFIFRDKTISIGDGGDGEPIPPTPTPCSLKFENFSKIGDCYVNSGETKEAIVYYKKSCNKKDNKKSCGILGEMYINQSNYSEAKIYLRKACKLGVDSACDLLKK